MPTIAANEHRTETAELKLERLAACSWRPIRVLHRGFQDTATSIGGIWVPFFVYGLDNLMTAPARPFVAPVVCARKAVSKRKSKSATTQIAAGTLGATWGIGKGVVGCAVSLAFGVVGVVEGVGLGVMFGVPAMAFRGVMSVAKTADSYIIGGPGEDTSSRSAHITLASSCKESPRSHQAKGSVQTSPS